MQNLLDFLARHFHWLVFLLLETVSGILLFSYNSYQGSVWLSTANAVTGKTLEMQADVEQYFSLKRLNEELSQRNLVLEQQLRIYRERLSSDSCHVSRATCAAYGDSSNLSPLTPHLSPLTTHPSPLTPYHPPLTPHHPLHPSQGRRQHRGQARQPHHH